MRAAVIVFPGSNCDRDVFDALKRATKSEPLLVWHKDRNLPPVDLIVLPGGFSYGDYLRCGAMAAQSPIMQEVVQAAKKGTHVLGICNGFQILTETGLLPGALIRNKQLKFICRMAHLRVESNYTAFTGAYNQNQVIKLPIAHHDGCFYADAETLKMLEDNNLIAFKYCDAKGMISDNDNPNGSLANIAGIFNKEKNVLGLMPHPERVVDAQTGGIDGKYLFDCLVNYLS